MWKFDQQKWPFIISEKCPKTSAKTERAIRMDFQLDRSESTRMGKYEICIRNVKWVKRERFEHAVFKMTLSQNLLYIHPAQLSYWKVFARHPASTIENLYSVTFPAFSPKLSFPYPLAGTWNLGQNTFEACNMAQMWVASLQISKSWRIVVSYTKCVMGKDDNI